MAELLALKCEATADDSRSDSSGGRNEFSPSRRTSRTASSVEGGVSIDDFKMLKVIFCFLDDFF